MVPTTTDSRPWRIRTFTRNAAVVLVAFATVSCIGCSKSDSHVPVNPVAGAIQFRGQPVEGAFVSLHPKNAIEGIPQPRASVAKDGTFTVSTFNGNDGAPEGDYIVTVQWYKPVRHGDDLVGGPNVLPAKYASPRTSDVTIHVAADENHLPPIQLR
ncbi:MAG TPA: hypothetical protein VHU84_17430 [Lacipirellulaceae bacterium]|nr:hypothetical protein [Lacipirellulaceae bacterium]